MPHSREEHAGERYVEGLKAVSTGGHELSMLSGHLYFMLHGTSQFPGSLWQVRRVPPEGLLVELTSFADYLLEPARRGLGLPSLHFLRQALNAMPDGPRTLALVREQFASEGLDFDDLADRARDKVLLKGKLMETGRPNKGVETTPLPKGDSTARRAAQLARRRPDLADSVRKGVLKLSTALLEAGIRKRPSALSQLRKAWRSATEAERSEFLAEISVDSPARPIDGTGLPIDGTGLT